MRYFAIAKSQIAAAAAAPSTEHMAHFSHAAVAVVDAAAVAIATNRARN